MNEIRQEVAFITGAGSGIGRATACRVVRRGAAIGLFDVDEEGLRVTAELIRAQGGKAALCAGDVTSEESLANAVASVVERFGGLDTAVACAGIEMMGTVVDTSLEDWQRVLAVNLTGVFLTARHTVPRLIERGGGSFVAVSSDAGVTGWQGWAAYCATKHGVIGLVRCLALDHGPQGVHSSCVCPSLVETPMGDRLMADLSAEEVDVCKSIIPLGRFLKPEEVAEVIAHLSSPEAAFTNGLVYALDGGETAGHYHRS